MLVLDVDTSTLASSRSLLPAARGRGCSGGLAALRRASRTARRLVVLVIGGRSGALATLAGATTVLAILATIIQRGIAERSGD